MLSFEAAKNWLPKSHRAERLAAFVVVIGMAVFEFAYARAGLFASIGRLALADDLIGGIFSGLFLLLTLWLFYRSILLAFTSNFAVCAFVLLILAFILATEFSYLRSIGRFTVTSDITYAITATSDQRAYSFAAFFSFAWLPAIAIIASLSIYFYSTRRERTGSKALLRDTVIFAVSYIFLYFLAPILAGQSPYSSSFDAFAQTLVNYAISGPVAVAAPPKRTTLAQVASARRWTRE
ncbi:MAG TPA: hypothetical protein PLR83_12065 [Pyrinomonadaceae bacterium]|nr:hypothetical protein [Pyrinomonadaceae bacterium]